jgi:hypothetical protein
VAEYRELNPPPELAEDVQCVWFDDRPQHTQLVRARLPRRGASD